MAALALSEFQPTAALTQNESRPRWEQTAASSAALTRPKERAFLIPSGASAYRIVITTGKIPKWVEPTISGFIAIQTLPDNWDSYAGKKISWELIRQSLDTLGLIMEEGSPEPSVVPLGNGGVQLEWHRRQQDLEITFASGEFAQFFYSNQITGERHEGFANDFAKLAQLLRNIA
jgi:hypothetical protein